MSTKASKIERLVLDNGFSTLYVYIVFIQSPSGILFQISQDICYKAAIKLYKAQYTFYQFRYIL